MPSSSTNAKVDAALNYVEMSPTRLALQEESFQFALAEHGVRGGQGNAAAPSTMIDAVHGTGSSRLRLNGYRWRGCRSTLLAAIVLVFLATRYAGAQEGLYAGVAAGWDRATADYTKGIGLDVPPATYRTATNSARGGFGTARASLGYRFFVARRTYVSTEFEAGFQRGDGVAGYLREGTALGDRDVWPGPWSVEKNHAVGANARVGYAPGGVLGEGGSVYFVTGVHWLRTTVRRGSDIGTESIRIAADHTLRPWVAGAGVEWGSRANRVGVEVRYAAADLEFRTGGDGSAIGMPRIDNAFALREVSVQVGYTRSF